MVNQIANLVVSAAQRSDANPASANAAPDAQSSDTFGSVLAKQIGQKSSSDSSAPSNSTAASNSSTANNAAKLKDKATDTSKLSQEIAPAPDAAALTLAMLGSIKPSTGSKTVDTAKGRDQQAIPAAPDTAANPLLLAGNPQIQLVNNVSAKAAIDAGGAGAIRAAGSAPAHQADATQLDAAGDKNPTSRDSVPIETPKTNALMASDIKTTLKSAHLVTDAGSATALRAASDKNAPAADPALPPAPRTDALVQSDIKSTPESAKAADLTVSLPVTQAIAQPASQPYTSSANAIAAPLGSSAWPAEFAQKITWMGSQQNQVAELHLNPPDLGPMSVVLSITDNQATAQFSSPHSAVREAIENAMPKLRESLADNGIMLGNATVSDQPARDNGAENFMRQRNNPRAETISVTEAAPLNITPTTIRRHNGMVDTFA